VAVSYLILQTYSYAVYAPRVIDQGLSKITNGALAERFIHKLPCLLGM
jgi:hypothetical protein